MRRARARPAGERSRRQPLVRGEPRAPVSVVRRVLAHGAAPSLTFALSWSSQDSNRRRGAQYGRQARGWYGLPHHAHPGRPSRDPDLIGDETVATDIRVESTSAGAGTEDEGRMDPRQLMPTENPEKGAPGEME